MSLVAFKRLVFILFQFSSSSPNGSINFCSDFISGVGFFFMSNLYVYLFVCFDLNSYLFTNRRLIWHIKGF